MIERLVGEYFIPIIGYEGLYEVSNFGRVISLPKKWFRTGMVAPREKGETLYKIQKEKVGYFTVRLRREDKYKVHKIHRLIAIHFIANPEHKPCVNHKNGIKTDNRIENLEWCTYLENTTHALNTGLFKNKGEDSPVSKLKDSDVLEIRRLLSVGSLTQSEVAKLYSVNTPAISKIHLRKRWKHI